MFELDWTTSSSFIQYFTLNSELHNWEEVYIQLSNQQTCTSNNHEKINGGPIFNSICANATL